VFGCQIRCPRVRRQLSLAPFLARLEDAGMAGLILGMDGAEPPPADTAVECCGRIAGLIHGRTACQRDDLPKCFPSGFVSVRWTLLLIHPRNAIDLDFPSRPQHGLNGCTHREIVFEKFPVHLVHGVKVFQVRKKNRDLDYILKAAVGRF
jgi:hypothetical protein